MLQQICHSAFTQNISSTQILTSQLQAQIDHQTLANAMNHVLEHFSFKASIRSTYTNDDSCNLFDRPVSMTIHEIEAMVGAIRLKSSNKVIPEFLSKIWRIDTQKVKSVIEQNSQWFRKSNENSFSSQYSTNDRLLQNTRIKSGFYTNTFFATSKVGKTTHGNTCAQFFVSNKVFVVIYLMRLRSDFIDALNLFCKEVEVPPKIVMDPAGEQRRNNVRKLLHQVESTPRYIKENTQVSNRAELYVGLF